MDESRLKDLARLQAVIDNPHKSYAARYQADRAKQNIIRQSKDHKLLRMRERLVKAARASDAYEEWKIANQIKDYLHEQKMDKAT